MSSIAAALLPPTDDPSEFPPTEWSRGHWYPDHCHGRPVSALYDADGGWAAACSR